MYARVMSLNVQEGKMDALISAVAGAVEPMLLNMEGFQGGFLFTDPAAGTALTVTIWETEDQMLAGERMPSYIERISKMTAVLNEPPIPQHFQASMWAWSGPNKHGPNPAAAPES